MTEMLRRRDLSPARGLSPAFCTALMAAWRSDGVRVALAARYGDGVTRAAGLAEFHTHTLPFDARKEEDVRKHGLKACGLPGCGAVEKSVHGFSVCSNCHRESYCCAQHSVKHWPEHRQACRAMVKARKAAAVAAAPQ